MLTVSLDLCHTDVEVTVNGQTVEYTIFFPILVIISS